MDSLRFDKYQEDDFDLFFSLVSSDSVMRFITGAGMSREQALARFEKILKTNRKHQQLGFFKVFEGDFHLGSAKLEIYPKDTSVFEVGYILKESAWGKGYGTRFCQVMLKLADQIEPKKAVIGIIDPNNHASRKILQKFGFETYFRGVDENQEAEKLILRKL